MGSRLQNQDLSFEELYEQGRESVPMVQELGDRILKDLRKSHPGVFDDAEFESGPLKEVDRAQAKITGDYGGDHSQIMDLARGRIIVETPEQIEALRQYLDTHKDDLSLVNRKDRFETPSNTGFRDINTNMRLPNGHVIEFRVEHRGLMNAAKMTHKPYERVQEIERRAITEDRKLTPDEDFSRKSILDEIRDIHRAPAEAAGLDRLLGDEGRARLAQHQADRVTPPATSPGLRTAFGEAAHDAAGAMAEIGRKAGPVAGAVLGTGAAAATYLSTGDAAEAAEVAYETVVPYGETQIDLANGDLEAAQRSATVESISISGAIAGGVGGLAMAGPIGGIVGGVAGGLGAGFAADRLLAPQEKSEFSRFYDSIPPSSQVPEHLPELHDLAVLKERISQQETIDQKSMMSGKAPDYSSVDSLYAEFDESLNRYDRNDLLSDIKQDIADIRYHMEQQSPVEPNETMAFARRVPTTQDFGM